MVLPDLLEYSKSREKDQPDALPWDEIPKADYTTWKYAYDINNIKTVSNERIKASPVFNQIEKDAAWLEKLNDKQYPLSLDRYREEQKQIKSTVKQIETLGKLKDPMHVETMAADATKYSSGDKDKSERYKQWLESRKTDVYLKEAVNVLDDMVSQKNLVYNK